MLQPKVQGTKELEAYVTFEDDMSAFAAIADHENQISKGLKCEYSIQPSQRKLFVAHSNEVSTLNSSVSKKFAHSSNKISYFYQEQNDVEFNMEALDEYFRKYGAIKSIDILKPKAQQAYITYRSDESAFAALLVNDYRIRQKIQYKYHVQLADTWKQPPQPNSTVESMALDEDEGYKPPIFMLNEDCFEKLFQQLDIDSLMNLLEVCKKFNALVHKQGFKYIKSIHYENAETSLAQLRRQLKCAGKYIDKLHIIQKSGNHCHRLFQILSKYVVLHIFELIICMSMILRLSNEYLKI